MFAKLITNRTFALSTGLKIKGLTFYFSLIVLIFNFNHASYAKEHNKLVNGVTSKQDSPKNIIMVIADGMGPAYTTGYRYFNDNPETKAIEQTIFDRHLIGLSSTYPAPESGYVTDSAAAATAMATGQKTYNDAIAVDVNKAPLLTVLEAAKLQGKKTGIVVTSHINHATPAAYLTHNEDRGNYDEIADSYIDNGIKADVYLGGGWASFIRKDRNLVQEFQQAGFQYIDEYKQLDTLDVNKPVFGLFADYALPWALDDSVKHRLKPMVEAATKQLSNENHDSGFFMLVEASLIDWAGHDNDIVAAMHEMDDLAAVMLYLERFVEEYPETLVILTADHSTGGLTLGAKKAYRWDTDILRNIKMTPEFIAKKLVAKEKLTRDEISQWLNFTLTTKEFNKIQKAKKRYKQAQAKFDLLEKAEQLSIIADWEQPSLIQFYRTALMKIIDKRTNTGWTTKGHTGIDVPVYAFGSQSELFRGQIDNTDIAKNIFTLLGR